MSTTAVVIIFTIFGGAFLLGSYVNTFKALGSDDRDKESGNPDLRKERHGHAFGYSFFSIIFFLIAIIFAFVLAIIEADVDMKMKMLYSLIITFLGIILIGLNIGMVYADRKRL
jgi:NADH:ubiquinone oxidoreductase subunit 3 (subunit A)